MQPFYPSLFPSELILSTHTYSNFSQVGMGFEHSPIRSLYYEDGIDSAAEEPAVCNPRPSQ